MDTDRRLESVSLDEIEQWVSVGHYTTLSEAYDHGLVILAMGEACRVTQGEPPEGYVLQAEAAVKSKIVAELEAYQLEILVPLTDINGFRYSNGLVISSLWVLIVSTIYLLQDTHPTWVARCVSSSIGFMGKGEWWRPFTALFLHADVSHLVGNLVSGLFFATLVSRWIGPWRAWPLILGSGTVGNAITSYLTYPAEFNSLGASSAVFGAVGILSGLGVAESMRNRLRLPWMKVFTPLFGGVVLLGMMGGSYSTQIDVLGHVFGFITGVLAGLITAAFSPKEN